MINLFKVGDIVKGLPGNGYGITNHWMVKGKVVSINDDLGSMRVEVLEHIMLEEIGIVYDVKNSSSKFKLVEDYSTFFIEYGSDPNG